MDGLKALETARMKPWPEHISNEVRELIAKLIEKDPTKRPSAEEVLNFPLIKKYVRLITEEKPYGEVIAKYISN